jgi:hypothetical protein
MVFNNFFKVGAYIGIIVLTFFDYILSLRVVFVLHVMCPLLGGVIRFDVIQECDLFLAYDIPLSGDATHCIP